MIGGVLFAVEMALLDNGVKFKAGSGTGAAADYFRSTATKSAFSLDAPKLKSAA
jgi:alanine-glyoxylate transaminase / serine-glyoxylate transaminase / serine-pyruvate transaminase